MENQKVTMEKVVSLAKRRGFVFASSEIYGGFGGVYDYGPMGVELANNIKAHWWQKMVRERGDIFGLDSAIFMSPRIWEASGHTANFADPLVECRTCHTRSRADHLLEDVGAVADEKMTIEEINSIFIENKSKIKCPKCGGKDFTDVKFFNLLVKSNLGDFSSEGDNPAYLRGETCQGIYVNYKNVLDTMHPKLPFGIAQTGKAFRNEITARQFIFRTREFEQMEMQYFTAPEDDMKEYEKLKEYRWNALLDLGLKEENLQWHKHDNLVFYAKEAYDIEYKFPFGWKELEGVHARGDYDLTQHSKGSGTTLDFLDQENNRKFIPHIIESSVGVGRLFLAILADSYDEEEVEGEIRSVLHLPKHLAPIKVAILPLSKKEELSAISRPLFDTLKKEFVCQYDETQSIGKRYRRQDEIGTPYCITVDFETINDKAVTVRDRDTMKQDRIAIDKLPEYLREKFK